MYEDRRTREELLAEIARLERRLNAENVHQLFEDTPLPYQSLDPTGRLLTVNRAWLDLLGYERDEVLGRWVGDFLTPDSVALLSSRFELFLDAGEVQRADFTFLARDGSPRTVTVNGRVAYDETGDPVRTHCVLHVDEALGAALRRRTDDEGRYRHFFKNAVEGLYQSTPEGRFLAVNPALAAMAGYDSPQEMTEAVSDIGVQLYVDPEDRVALMAALRETGYVAGRETRLRRRDGGSLWVSEHSRAVVGDSGDVVLYEGSVVDVTQRKEAEFSLELTQFSMDNAPLDIAWVNRDGRFVYVNDHVCESLGYSREELLSMTIRDVSAAVTAEIWKAYWAERRTYAVKRFETTLRRKDGSELPVGVTSHYRRYQCEEYLFIFAYDLTEREAVENDLRHSQELLSQVERISLTGGWEIDLRSGGVHWTEGEYDLYGWDHSQPPPDVETFLATCIHPSGLPEFQEAWDTVSRDGTPVEMEYRIVRPNGEERILYGMAVPEMDADGRTIRVAGANRDVTAERSAASELERSHQRLLAILDGIDADICVSSLADGEALFMNAHMRERFDVPSAEKKRHDAVRNQPARCAVCPKERLLGESEVPTETLTSESYDPATGRWRLNHDRTIRWLGDETAHMHMAADITEFKALEEQLTETSVKAEAASVAKSEFLANMSHEIRTPLNGLLGMLQLLQLSDLMEDQRNFLDTAMESGRNLLQILNDILDISKVESGKLELVERPLELGEVLESVSKVFRQDTESRGVGLTWRIDPSLERRFLADDGRLRQILFNLVGNAVKFTESGRILVEAYPLPLAPTADRARLFFSVSDTGIGIAEADLGRIFAPFTQVDGSSTRRYQGSGLGLGIVRRLVDLMHGSISVSSEPGRGTTVGFTAEVRRLADDGRNEAGAARAPLRQGYSVLVAEDERVNRYVAKQLLEKLGHRPHCVVSGEAALEELERRRYDCVLMDIQMPGLDGMETTRVIRDAMRLDVPVIALTAHAMKGDRQTFLDAGMNGYVAKPFGMEDLQDELLRVMLGDERTD